MVTLTDTVLFNNEAFIRFKYEKSFSGKYRGLQIKTLPTLKNTIKVTIIPIIVFKQGSLTIRQLSKTLIMTDELSKEGFEQSLKTLTSELESIFNSYNTLNIEVCTNELKGCSIDLNKERQLYKRLKALEN